MPRAQDRRPLRGEAFFSILCFLPGTESSELADHPAVKPPLRLPRLGSTRISSEKLEY